MEATRAPRRKRQDDVADSTEGSKPCSRPMSAPASEKGNRKVARPQTTSTDAKIPGSAKTSTTARGQALPGGKQGRQLLARKKLRRVLAPMGKAQSYEPARERKTKPETRRTPGSAAGCNKPARLSAEQTIKTARNREGGTRPVPWQEQAEAQSRKVRATSRDGERRSGRRRLTSMEGRSLETPREVLDRKTGQQGMESVSKREATMSRFRSRKADESRNLEATRKSQTNSTRSNGKGQRPENQFPHEMSSLNP